MTRSDARACAVLLLAVVTCARSTDPDPRLTGIDPASGPGNVATPIVIHGERLYVKPVQIADSPSTVDARYRAWLGPVELSDVVWIDEATLHAVVPAGLPPGAYALTIESPFGRRATLDGAYTVTVAPAALTATLAPLPARVNVGQTFEAAVDVVNVGDAAATGVNAAIAAIPSTAADAGPAPGPSDLVPGGTARFTRAFVPRASGLLAITATATGTDAAGGGLVSSAPASGTVLVQVPASLEVSLSLGPEIGLGDQTLVLTVANRGEALALDVGPSALISSGVPIQILSAPSQPVSLAAGEVATFTWTIRLQTEGALVLATNVTGVDANDGSALDVPVTAFTTVCEVVHLADPFGDGTTFAYVVGYRGQVYVGPSRGGTRLVRMNPDGTAPESLSLSFQRDTAGTNVSSNTKAPYGSIGYTGCIANSYVDACGPDNEDGRGLLAAVTIAGEEWLVIGGARSLGDLDYVYMTQDPGPLLPFSYVDLSLFLGGNTRGFSAAYESGGRVYLGFPDNGGNRPYGIALITTPGVPGLDATASDAIDLRLDEAFKKALGPFAAIAMVDAIAQFGGRLYFVNNIGCVVSTNSTPAGSADFVGCSPTVSTSYDPKASLVPTKQYDLEPADRAWPALAEWGGRLYAIRNTTAGPQLWVCDPAGGASAVACDPGDWSVVAPDASHLTRFGNVNAVAATMLVATSRHLYVGFNDPIDGLQIFRTAAATPTTAADFTGKDGCIAGTAGCQGVGGNGLDQPSVYERIFDAKAISFGGVTAVYLTAGDGISPVALFRITD